MISLRRYRVHERLRDYRYSLDKKFRKASDWLILEIVVIVLPGRHRLASFDCPFKPTTSAVDIFT